MAVAVAILVGVGPDEVGQHPQPNAPLGPEQPDCPCALIS